MGAGGLGLDAVERQEGEAVLGRDDQSIRVIAAAELAVVLAQIAVIGGETARGIGQRQPPEGEQLAFDPVRARLDQRGGGLAAQFDRQHPAFESAFGEKGQGALVVEIDRVPGDEGPAFEKIERGEVAGLDQETLDRRRCVSGF